MPRILIRPRAENDLAEIWDFIAEDSQARADSFLDRIDQSFYDLAGNPNIGRARGELSPNLRSIPFGRYVIFYLALPDGIEIVRVLHGARDLNAIFHAGE
ncbi:MAG: type II toxin-antitoxin system RelE/ParE family toxin [Methylocella sp.]